MANLFRRLFAPSVREGRALALLDFHEHTRGGHFGFWLRWFACEFARRFDEVCVVTPDPALTRSLFQGPEGTRAPNVSFHRLPRRLRKSFDLECLRRIDGLKKRELGAFVMWAFDLLDLAPPRTSSSIPWGALSGLSWFKRGHTTPSAEKERRLLQLFHSAPSCRGFMQPDAYLNDAVDKAFWIPDVENVALPPQRTELAKRIESHASGRFCVGAFGILSGPRCLDELLLLAREQVGVRFVLAGRIPEDTVASHLRPLLREGALPNLLVVQGFIPTEEELNAAIQASDAVFIDGQNYPVQSGIVCKAIHLGRCILTPRSNSWTCDFVTEWQAGIVYESRADGIAEAWTRWKLEGGEARSRAASAAVRDPLAVAACFDGVTNELTNGFTPSSI